MTVGFLVVLPLSIYLPWSSAVYPTQAKKRLEWGTQPLLLVQGVSESCRVVTTSNFLCTGKEGGCPIQAGFLA